MGLLDRIKDNSGWKIMIFGLVAWILGAVLIPAGNVVPVLGGMLAAAGAILLIIAPVIFWLGLIIVVIEFLYSLFR